MTGRVSRLRRLEDRARQATADQQDQNGATVRAALALMSDTDLDVLLSAVQAAGGRGLPVRPWDAPPDDLPEEQRRAWVWAAQVTGLSAAHLWPFPPPSAPEVCEWAAAAQSAAKANSEDPETRQSFEWGRVGWVMLGCLAHVMLEEGNV
jgi:hypothetical protein